MRRREFIAALLGGTLTSFLWPLTPSAQRRAVPVLAFLHASSRGADARIDTAFRQGLAEAGYVVGRNIEIDDQFADGQLDRLPSMVAELVRRQVAVIVVTGSDAARAATNATTTIPIVFNIGNDPVQTGLVASFNRPGGNITGVTVITREMQGKRLAMARELLANASIIATLSNPISGISGPNLRDLEEAATSAGQRLLVLRTSSDDEIKEAFVSMAAQGVNALFVNPNPFFSSRTELITALAARHRVPTVFANRDPVVAGGLMSYGTDFAESSRQAGLYAARVLKGENPGDLPILRPTKFELVINLKTAKSLGLSIPETLLAIADEVIQ
jgi:putative tryptophan/tyrosine transport system substrate-binding protein